MRYTDRFMRWSAPAQVATEEEVHDDPEEADCAICYGQYSQGESIRRLKCGRHDHFLLMASLEGRKITGNEDQVVCCREQEQRPETQSRLCCVFAKKRNDYVESRLPGHTFHCHCIDTWLLGHQNKCPLCGFVVGPPTEDLTGTEDTPGGGVG